LRVQPFSIWIGAEQWDGNKIYYEDENTDVIVKLENGTEWSATFFTYQNIISLSKKNEATGECLNGK
jgi:hypothetical protein